MVTASVESLKHEIFSRYLIRELSLSWQRHEEKAQFNPILDKFKLICIVIRVLRSQRQGGFSGAQQSQNESVLLEGLEADSSAHEGQAAG